MLLFFRPKPRVSFWKGNQTWKSISVNALALVASVVEGVKLQTTRLRGKTHSFVKYRSKTNCSLFGW